MADNLIIKIDGDASNLEKELDNAAGTGVRAFKRFSDGTNEQLDRMQDLVDEVRLKLIEMGEDGELSLKEMGEVGKTALKGIGRQAKDTAQKGGDAGEAAANRVAGALSKLKTILKGIAGTMIAREVMKIGKESIGLASDLVEVQNVLDVTFGEGNEKIEAFAQTAAKRFGMSELSARKMAGTMGAMLKSMDVKNVDEMAISLVGLAGDMGSFYNLDAEEAFAKLRSGISGETEPLKQLGINMSVANLEAYALSSGISKAYKDMSAAEQATLRYNYIMHATADAQGDFARTSGSMANQLKIAKLNIENMKASLGKALLPAATAATTAFNNMITNVQDGFPRVKAAVTEFVENAGAELDRFGIGERLTKGLEGAKTLINEGLDYIMRVLRSAARSPIMQEIWNGVMSVFKTLLEVWDSVGALLGTLGEYLEPVWQSLKAGVSNFVDAFLQAKLMLITILNQVYKLVKSAIDLIIGILTLDKDKIISGLLGIWNAVLNIGKAIFKGVSAVLESIWKGIVNFFSTLKEKVKKKIEEMNLKENGKTLLDSLKQGFDEGWEKVKAWFTEKKEAVLKKIGEIDLKAKAIDVLSSMLAGFIEGWLNISVWLLEKKEALDQWIENIDLQQKAAAALATLKAGFIEKWEEITTWFGEKKQEITSWLTGIDLKEVGKSIINSLKSGIESAWDSLIGTIEDLINSALDKLPDSAFQVLGIERKRVSLRGPDKSAPQEEEEQEEEEPKPAGKRKVLGIYEKGTMTPEQAMAAASAKKPAGSMPYGDPRSKAAKPATEAAEAVTEAAEAIEKSAERTERAAISGTEQTISATQAAAIAAKETGTAALHLQEAAQAAAEQSGETAEAVSEVAEAASDLGDAAETLGTSAGKITDDGVQFSMPDGDLDKLLDGIGDEIELNDGTPDLLSKGEQWVGKLFGIFFDAKKSAEDGLSGVDSHVVKGFNDVIGKGEGSSDYTLFDEYTELMGLWSGNKDANGEWIADWSKGGIGETLRDLVHSKMPGKYWGDLTPEDLQRMKGMTASAGYVQGQYQSQFGTGTTDEPVTIPANLEIVGIETEEGAEDVLDLDAMKEAVPEETILSWEALNAALQAVYTTLAVGMEAGAGGGESTGGLVSAFSQINSMLNEGIPAGIELTAGMLEDRLPAAAATAAEALGKASADQEGNLKAEGGNTLYTALGTIKTTVEDIGAAFDTWIGQMESGIPRAVQKFKQIAATAINVSHSIAAAGWAIADAYNAAADAVYNLIGALQALADVKGGGGGGGDGGGGGGGDGGHAHGGSFTGVSVVGEHGPEVISTSRNLNVFTNRTLEIAQEKIAGMLARDISYAGIGSMSTSANIDNSRTTSVSIGTVLGEDWLGNEINRRIERLVEREMFYAR